MNHSIVYQHQKPLIRNYRYRPAEGMITDCAKSTGQVLEDPFHTEIELNETMRQKIPVGLHKAVGGLHDEANPGDLLCGALTACMDSTIRMIANRMNLSLLHLSVQTQAKVDVRGTLMVDTEVPVAFQQMQLGISLRIKGSEDKKALLLQMAKHCCVVYQTLKKALPIEVTMRVMNFEKWESKDAT